MRISTNQIYQAGTRQLLDLQSKMYTLQNQMSSGKKFLTAQDDPVGAVQVLLNTQSMSINTQYSNNQQNAASQLALEEDRLQSVVDAVLAIQEQVVAGGNASYSDAQRSYIAENLKSQLAFLLGMANSTDANGYYLFSGYQGHTKPFQTQADGSVVYAGDDGQRLLQVGASRQIAISDSGRDIFENIRTGNGTFSLSAAAGNTGTGVIAGGSVNDMLAWTGDNYQIQFTSPTSYTVTDVTTSTVLGSYTYTAESEITAIPGISFQIAGAPAAGDAFDVAPSSGQSIFTTLSRLIDAFNTPTAGNPAAAAEARNIINTEQVNLARVLENVSTVQASIGSRRAEIESLSNVSSALDLHYQERLSNLQEVDLVQAISDFTQLETQLQAAQSSFAKITALSLFNYI